MKTSLIATSLLIFSLNTSAQVERNTETMNKDTSTITKLSARPNKQNRKERMKELNLTREQKMQMKEIMQSGKASRESIENNAQLSDAEKKKQLHELKKSQAQKIQAILTPEQRAKYKEYK